MSTTPANPVRDLTLLLAKANLSEDQLRQLNSVVVSMIKAKIADKNYTTARKLNIGDVVTFTDGKKRSTMVYTGRIEAINTKTCTIAVFPHKRLWRVPMSLIRGTAADDRLYGMDNALAGIH